VCATYEPNGRSSIQQATVGQILQPFRWPAIDEDRKASADPLESSSKNSRNTCNTKTQAPCVWQTRRSCGAPWHAFRSHYVVAAMCSWKRHKLPVLLALQVAAEATQDSLLCSRRDFACSCVHALSWCVSNACKPHHNSFTDFSNGSTCVSYTLAAVQTSCIEH